MCTLGCVRKAPRNPPQQPSTPVEGNLGEVVVNVSH